MNNTDYYRYASGVDILKDDNKYDSERMKGYRGEFVLFNEIMKMPLDFDSKVLMNVEIERANSNSQTTEIDCLLITSRGIISFEVKNYKGTIYGKQNEEYWTQYFRSAPNSKFRSPLKQNEFHLQALRKMFDNVPLFSVVLFTNPECDISKVVNRNSLPFVIRTEDISSIINRIYRDNPEIYSSDDTEKMYQKLFPYSHASDIPSEQDDIKSFGDLVSSLQGEYQKEKKNFLRKLVVITGGIFVGVALIAFMITISVYGSLKKNILANANHTIEEQTAEYILRANQAEAEKIIAVEAQNQLAKEAELAKEQQMLAENRCSDMERLVSRVSDENLIISKKCVDIHNLSFSESSIYEGMNEFSFEISALRSETKIGYSNAKVYVKYIDGTINEFNFSDYIDYAYQVTSTNVKLSKMILIPNEISKIEYIKLMGLLYYADASAYVKKEYKTFDALIYENEHVEENELVNSSNEQQIRNLAEIEEHGKQPFLEYVSTKWLYPSSLQDVKALKSVITTDVADGIIKNKLCTLYKVTVIINEKNIEFFRWSAYSNVVVNHEGNLIVNDYLYSSSETMGKTFTDRTSGERLTYYGYRSIEEFYADFPEFME